MFPFYKPKGQGKRNLIWSLSCCSVTDNHFYFEVFSPYRSLVAYLQGLDWGTARKKKIPQISLSNVLLWTLYCFQCKFRSNLMLKPLRPLFHISVSGSGSKYLYPNKILISLKRWGYSPYLLFSSLSTYPHL